MKLLPGQAIFEIRTLLSKEAVMEILKKNTTDRHPLNVNPIPPSTPFRGGIYDYEFEVRQSVWFWHVYMPIFRGEIQTVEGNTVMYMRASNAYLSFNIGLGWAWSIAFFLLGARTALQSSQDFPTGIAFMIFGLLAPVGLLLWTSWYLQKVEEGKKHLQSLFVVKPTRRPPPR